ncbi:zinc-dependent metalloprotease [Luminiphilus sp. nBUS_07]|uniref:zinc-dependent metalloprotease n=1 Tax=Luminiphilus sp. nBUS_07 TaxID=3395314 RepID=UPI003EBC8A76
MSTSNQGCTCIFGFKALRGGRFLRQTPLLQRPHIAVLLVVLGALMLLLAAPSNARKALDFDTLTAESEQQNGFIPLYWHTGEGRLYGEVARLNTPFIYYPSLSQGVGSNDLGLDRGRLGDTQLVQFERVGPRLLLIALNTRYRASSDNPNERRAVSEGFARSVLWGFDIAAEQSGRILIDLTAFAQRDALGLSGLLEESGEGSYAVDSQRSAINLARSKAFPDNTEIDALVTLVGHPQGKILQTVAPDAGAVTLHLHHSFVRLPDDGYTPLPYDPRAGFIDGGEGDLFYDYAAPLGEPVKRGYARRHRLERKHPDREMSEAIEPIVYYVDSGVPEPIRSALVEGASWWNQAFEAAGFIDGFQVKILPDGVDPMDVRYNVIQWVHRSTRGWSYGMSVRDPRTQEIIKGHVSLGSLRVRQDYLLAEGLLAPYKEGVDEAEAAKDLEAFALARIRQLSAHEVGHTIGLEHNFAASADDRASVMDYPHPYVTLTENGEVDLSDAYAVGIGAWDKQVIRWGYSDFPDDTDAVAARAELMNKLLTSGLSFVADKHARAGSFDSGAGPSHSRGSLWDNGADPVVELNRIMSLRRVVLDNFSEAVIRKGQPLAKIEDALVPAYLMHRYQLQAAATVLGGRNFTYALRGDGQPPTTVIDGERQRAALNALLATLSPAALTLSPELVALIPPRPPMSGNSRELFPRNTGYLFDPVAAAGTASILSLQVLLDPKRAARLNQLAAVSGGSPNFPTVLDALFKATWVNVEGGTALNQLIAQQVQRQMVDGLVLMAAELGAASAVRADAWGALNVIKGHVGVKLAEDIELDAVDINVESWRAHYWFIGQQIAAAATSNDVWRQAESLVPPGSPI